MDAASGLAVSIELPALEMASDTPGTMGLMHAAPALAILACLALLSVSTTALAQSAPGCAYRAHPGCTHAVLLDEPPPSR